MIDPVLDYRMTLLNKIGIKIKNSQKVLDAGCGDGGDTVLLAENAREIIGIDIDEHSNWPKIKKSKMGFQKADICALPFNNGEFDVTFVKDVLHHAYDPGKALREVKRVTAGGGTVVIIEANRFNPIFYLHMTLMLGHQHFTRSKFKRIVSTIFPEAEFGCFECRVYPINNLFIRKLCHKFEDVVENIPLFDKFLTYNYAIAELK